ncbi:type II toxin-antitoxin system RatA family toxin [Hellea balneolensis]|uniref:type II toxin-antitoxin system RatA family toxin n=1 Tax=Hellea balneolensis TaxID=287478 RepID=UPI000417D9D3|nr:type II toxin-antitoxin system RatA family toxin [Hellea balneolensis]
MPTASFTRHICHDADELLEMVANVEDYPTFINLISALRITKKISETDFEAEAIVAYKMIRESFKSLIHIERDKKFIRVTKAEKGGAVKTLENTWKFHPLSDGTTAVEFFVDVSLKAFPLNMLIRDKMDKASDVIMDAFTARAKQICKPVKSDGLDLTAEYKRLGLV